MIDLHAHSTFSDGSLTPGQLVKLAAETGLTALALTDHDSTGGLDLFMAACEEAAAAGGPAPVGIPGVEISADVAKGTMHILAYFFDQANAPLQEGLAHIRGGREARNHEILDKLKGLGIELTWEEVQGYAGEEVVGRPHFARAMLDKGYVRSASEAFDRYLAKGKPAYADRFRLSPSDSIALIRQAGGVPVLAHPSTLQLAAGELRDEMVRLKECGLEGVEVYYSEHSHELVARYRELAEELDLALTGGSDFHGEINPGIKLGIGFGSLRVPDGLVDELRTRARRIAANA